MDIVKTLKPKYLIEAFITSVLNFDESLVSSKERNIHKEPSPFKAGINFMIEC
jgi:hypothetical protein